MMQLNNVDVVKKFIFRYLDLPLTNGSGNTLVNITDKDIPNKFIDLNKFLNNVCIIRVIQRNILIFLKGQL
jgi:hypothetical protein